jgi:hypothetical protein
MIEIEAREHVAASPERVFAAIADIDRMHEWSQGLVRLERLTDGPVGVGTRWRETRRVLGREGSEVFEVTGLEAGRSLDLYVDGKQGSSRRGAYRFHYLVDRREGGSLVLVTGEIEGMGIAARLFRRQLERAVARDLAALKRHVESAT